MKYSQTNLHQEPTCSLWRPKRSGVEARPEWAWPRDVVLQKPTRPVTTRTRRLLFAAKRLLVLASLNLNACSTPAPTSENSYPIKVQVRSSQGTSLSNARIRFGQKDVGATDAMGQLVTTQAGREGGDVAVYVQCPKGFRSPELPSTVRLTRTRALDDSNGQSGAVVELTCESEVRDVAIVVHVDGGKGLPVRVGAESLASTDSNGNAQIMLHLDRNQSSVEVGIDTDSRRELLPRNPSRTFSLGRNDALVVYQERLSAERAKLKIIPKKRIETAQPPPRVLPVRLD